MCDHDECYSLLLQHLRRYAGTGWYKVTVLGVEAGVVSVEVNVVDVLIRMTLASHLSYNSLMVVFCNMPTCYWFCFIELLLNTIQTASTLL